MMCLRVIVNGMGCGMSNMESNMESDMESGGFPLRGGGVLIMEGGEFFVILSLCNTQTRIKRAKYNCP